MSAPFYDLLANYYAAVGKVLRGEAAPASIFPNASDIGSNREIAYATFLKQHVPSKCEVRFGGFLFHEDGAVSKQLDVIVTTDTAARFDFNNEHGHAKTFSCVEGTLAVFSIKSNLGKEQLYEALLNLASIPPTRSIKDRIPPKFVIADYEDWPYKFIYASDGMSAQMLNQHLNSFYADHSDIPVSRRPNMIHVAGKHFTMRAKPHGWTFSLDTVENAVPPDHFGTMQEEPDVQAIMWMQHYLQLAAETSTQILFSSGHMLEGVCQALLRRGK